MKAFYFTAFFFLFGLVAPFTSAAQENKNFKSVVIGNQTWMAENLNVTTYRNGDSIPQVQDPKAWSDLKTGAWCYYDGKRELGSTYGKLYNWYAVHDPRGLAPEGWHIATDADWTELTKYIGGKLGSGVKIKFGKGWNGNGNGTNETGFGGLPGGTRSVELFSFAGSYGYWWTSSEFDSYSSWNRYLSYNNNDVGRSTGWKQFGNSVRCVKGDIVIEGSKTEPVIDNKTDSSRPAPDSTKLITNPSKPVVNYSVAAIGDQVWMSQNLNVSNFENGDTITEAMTEADWKKAEQLQQPAWCYYNNDSTNKTKYGKLYNWYAVNDKRLLAPTGWHLPTQDDWTKLVNNLGGKESAARKLKEVSEGNGTNESGFSALLGGFRDSDAEFHNNGFAAYWWSATENLPATAWCNSITYISSVITDNSSCDKGKGFSVRCIKD